MIRLAFLILLAPLLSGCWIYTNIQGNGTVTSPATGNFNCSTGQAGDCREEYASAGSETLEATADPGHTFAKWAGCLYESLETCTTSWTQTLASDPGSVTVTATFKEQHPAVQAAQYTYNGLGQRITKTVNGQTTIFQYDLDGKLMAEIDAATGTAVRQHIHVNGEPVAQLTTNPANGRIGVQYVHADHLGTPTLLTNQLGQVVVDIEAMPFGETYIDYAEVTHNRRFPGQYKDEETGLHYNYFRDYDPSLGRYIQSDPIGLYGGLNTYGYAWQSPLKFTDKWGLYVKLCARKLAALDKTSHIHQTPVEPRGSLLRHDFISVSGSILSFQAGSNMAWSKGRIDTTGEVENPMCKMVCDDDKFDKYVYQAQREVGTPNYCLVAYGHSGAANCQSWARRVLALAKDKYLDKEECPKCWGK